MVPYARDASRRWAVAPRPSLPRLPLAHQRTAPGHARRNRHRGRRAAHSPPLRVGGTARAPLPQAAYWAVGVSVSRACAHRAGADARGDLVEPPVKLPVVAEVVLPVEPLGRPQRERAGSWSWSGVAGPPRELARVPASSARAGEPILCAWSCLKVQAHPHRSPMTRAFSAVNSSGVSAPASRSPTRR